MKEKTLLLLRVSVGLLILLWGIDKIVNVEHGLAVSDRYYLGAFSNQLLLKVWGALQTAVGALTIMGLLRRFAYPLVILMNTATLLGVWKSIIDPWGWFIEGTNVLFFPSLIIFAGSLLLWAFMDEDRLALDTRRRGREAHRPEPHMRVPHDSAL